MAKVDEASKLLNQFKDAINKNDLPTSKRLLSSLKLKMTEFDALPPKLSRTPTADKELQLARDILEHAVFLSVKLQDEAVFERNYAQLKVLYTDTRDLLPASPLESLITGLNLLRLLVQNRIAEFHTELELIPREVQAAKYVTHATQLEEWLMEGAYNKVLAARSNTPDASYTYFMDKLLTTVRDEIAGCSERAYSRLSVADAKKLMLFSSDREALEYAEERGWHVKDGQVSFQAPEHDATKPIPSLELISHSLTYAKELERIV